MISGKIATRSTACSLGGATFLLQFHFHPPDYTTTAGVLRVVLVRREKETPQINFTTEINAGSGDGMQLVECARNLHLIRR